MNLTDRIARQPLQILVVALLVVAAVVIVARHAALARRVVASADSTLHHSLDWLPDDPSSLPETEAHDTPDQGRAPAPEAADWGSAVVAELSVAEDLLDWAEAAGYAERELVVLGESAFLVRWRNP